MCPQRCWSVKNTMTFGLRVGAELMFGWLLSKCALRLHIRAGRYCPASTSARNPYETAMPEDRLNCIAWREDCPAIRNVLRRVREPCRSRREPCCRRASPCAMCQTLSLPAMVKPSNCRPLTTSARATWLKCRRILFLSTFLKVYAVAGELDSLAVGVRQRPEREAFYRLRPACSWDGYCRGSPTSMMTAIPALSIDCAVRRCASRNSAHALSTGTSPSRVIIGQLYDDEGEVLRAPTRAPVGDHRRQQFHVLVCAAGVGLALVPDGSAYTERNQRRDHPVIQVRRVVLRERVHGFARTAGRALGRGFALLVQFFPFGHFFSVGLAGQF